MNNVFELTYIGRRFLTGGTLGYWYQKSDGTGWGGTKKPMVSGHPVGSIVEMTASEDKPDHYFTGGDKRPRVIGVHEDAAQRAAWELESRTHEAHAAKDATERRIMREAGSPLDDLIQPLRDALDQMPWTQRAAAVMLITSKLR